MYEKLLEEAFDIECDLQECSNVVEELEKIKNVIHCYKEMYKLAKGKQTSNLFINQILDAGFQSATSGYHIVQKMTKDDPKLLEEFQNECKYFSQAREDNLKDMM